jgi:hypothetical protein
MVDTQEFILLIMNCQKYRGKAMKQKQTWLLSSLPREIIYYHVLGNPDLPTDFEFVDSDRILWVKTQDDYNSLPKKVIAAYYAITQRFHFEYILKTDDDQELVNRNFLRNITNTIKSLKPKTHYGGKNVIVKQPYYSKYNLIHPELPENLPIQAINYCSGRFYFLSKEAVSFLLLKRDKIEKEYLEDYSIGLHIHPMFKTNICNVDSDKIFVDYQEW